jgi:hypothetical protein
VPSASYQVLVDDRWCPAALRARNRTEDGWEAFVHVTTTPGSTYIRYVLADHVRKVVRV